MSGLSVNPLQISGRRPQDMWASVVFALFFAATIGITIYHGHSLKNLAASCTDTEGNLRNVDLHLGGNTSAPEETDVTEILDGLVDALQYIIGAAAFAVLFVSIWMVLLRYFAEQVIYATLITKGVALFGIAGYLCVFPIEEEPYWGLGCAAIGALYCLWICCARRRIALTAKLVEQSVKVVATHPGLFAVSGVLFIVKIASVALCFVSALAVIASKISVTNDDDECDVTFGEFEIVDIIQFGVCFVFFFWTITIWLTMKRYIFSLVTGTWYYEHESLAAQEGTLTDKQRTRAPICTGIKLACSSGFGTIAFASLILAICEFLKSIVKSMKRENDTDKCGLACLITCCLQCIVDLFEFASNFALSYSALTGESFCKSGKTFLSHCSRHGFVKVYVVDALAGMIFRFGAFVFALLTMGVMLLVAKARVRNNEPDMTHKELMDTLIVVGVISFVLSGIIFHFVMSLLLMIVDAAYSCVVLDLDNYGRTNQFHRPAIAVVVMQKVKPDFVVVQQPDLCRSGQPIGTGAAECGARCRGAPRRSSGRVRACRRSPDKPW